MYNEEYEDNEVAGILSKDIATNPTENLTMSPITSRSNISSKCNVDRFFSTPTDPFPIYCYGQNDDLAITSISAKVILKSLNILETYTKRFKLQSDYFDFLDNLEFEDIVSICSSVRENIEQNRPFSHDVDPHMCFDSETANKWVDIIQKVEHTSDPNTVLKSDFFQMLQLVQHAKRMAASMKNEGNFNVWKCMAEEEDLRAVFETINPEAYPFFLHFQLDRSLYFLTVSCLEEQYKTGYEKIKELLNGEEPFLHLHHLSNLSSTEITEFTNQLCKYCKEKKNVFETNEKFQNEQYLFAQSLLTGLRTMKFATAEKTLVSISNCLKIRNAFLTKDLPLMINLNSYDDQKTELLRIENQTFKDEILSLVETITTVFQKMLNDRDAKTRQWNDHHLRTYINVLSQRYVLKKSTGEQNRLSMYEECIHDMQHIKGLDSKTLSDMSKLDDFVQGCTTNVATDLINTICWNVYSEVAITETHTIHEDLTGKKNIQQSRFLTNNNYDENEVFKDLCTMYLSQHIKSTSELEEFNVATRFQKAISQIDNCTHERSKTAFWNKVEKTFKKKLSSSEVNTKTQAKASLVEYAYAVIMLYDKNTVQDQMMLEYVKAKLFDISEFMIQELEAAKATFDQGKSVQRPESLLRVRGTSSKASTSTVGNTFSTSSSATSTASIVPTTASGTTSTATTPFTIDVTSLSRGAGTNATVSATSPTLGRDSELLVAKPFKRGFSTSVTHEIAREWAVENNLPSLPKLSTHRIESAKYGDVYIFQRDLTLKKVKDLDGFLWRNDGGGSKAVRNNVKRIYYRAIEIDGSCNTKKTKVSFEISDTNPPIVIYWYQVSTSKCLPIGTELKSKSASKKGTKRKRKHARDGSDGNDTGSSIDSTDDQNDPLASTSQPVTSDPATNDPATTTTVTPDANPVPGDTNTVALDSQQVDDATGGLCIIPAMVRNLGIEPRKVWQEDDFLAAFRIAAQNNYFQDATRYAINDPVPNDLYCLNAANMHKDNWYHDIKLDSYLWTEQTCPSIMSNKHSISHRKYIVMTATGDGHRKAPSSLFQKHVYYESATSNCIIFYIGTLEGIERAPHGNSKNSRKRPFFTTAKSVTQAIRSDASAGRTAGQTLGDLKSNVPSGIMPLSFKL